MLYQLDFDFINYNRDKTFVAISKMYELIQKSPENFTVSTFFDEMENFPSKITQA